MTALFKAKRPCRGKRFILLIAALFIVFSAFALMSIPSASASADTDESEETWAEIEKNIEELLSALDTEEMEEYLNSLNESILSGKSLAERIEELITGDYKMDYSSLLNSVLSLFFDEAKTLFPVFSLVLAVCVFMSILHSVQGDFLSGGISGIIRYAAYSVILILILTAIIPAISKCKETVDGLKTQIEIFCPVIITLMAASGGSVSAAVYRPAAAFLSGGVCEAITDIVFPIAILLIALAAAGGISERVSLNGFGKLLKSVNKWVIGVCVTLFSVFLTVQGITSAGYDGISLRALKYAVGSGVPMVGGMLSGGTDLVLAGSALIKNSVGAVAVFAIICAVCQPLILLASISLLLRFTAAATEPLSENLKMSGFLNGIADNMAYFTAGLLSVALTYFVTIILLICSSGVIF